MKIGQQAFVFVDSALSFPSETRDVDGEDFDFSRLQSLL
jgi:hypothetical protein